MPEYTLLKKPQDPPVSPEEPVLHKECGSVLEKLEEPDGSYSCNTCLKVGYLST